MMTVNRPVHIAVVLVLVGITAGPTATRAADEPQPTAFVALKFEGTCDENNNRLWLTNTHTFKTVSATVRWRAAGGKNLTDEFFPGPNSIREIGCAAEAEIIEAKFADF